MGCHGLLQGIFPTQGSNLGLPHCRQMIYQLSYEGSPFLLVVVSIFALFIFNLFCYVHDGSWLFDIILIGSSFQQYKTFSLFCLLLILLFLFPFYETSLIHIFTSFLLFLMFPLASYVYLSGKIYETGFLNNQFESLTHSQVLWLLIYLELFI